MPCEPPLNVLYWVAAQTPTGVSPDSSAASTRGRVTDAKSGIDEHARVEHAAGIDLALRAA
jgi:hypothetical protein